MPQYDSEGYTPIVLSWKARMLVHMNNDIETAKSLLEIAHKRIKPNRKFQEVRCFLNIARAWKVCGEPDKAIEFGKASLAIANQSGYRYYAMRSRQLLSTLVTDDTERARHQSIASSLTRSLAASLSKMDAESFSARNLVC